ncbi:glucokinase (plasmid) [Natrialba magadii ATCC 43099]|uniref:Glucokinase n=1 Tax=Natrialba magadii (strain ATCC 43099 / DSM 3394 / CCM 3739 / CIP 104546 / IAM 13178 / JCM 8861 / NBRC 102185 / NCIMB 2190 / MS3) TaxID=547559 RepID=D3T1C2_NATMM|nr:ROK family protein [Natrialba magadii]ADD07381.1 glucokinase [Natrialba magadii ATCC 43099]ELY32405.1 ROK family protein [Natrialba magadii ATCC 43099]
MYAVGVDLGATNVRAVVGDDTGTIVGRARARTPQGPTADAVTRAVLDVVREACRDASVEPSTIAGAGIGSMGVIDRDAGTVGLSSNLGTETESLDPIPLVDPLADLLETDAVVLHNDTLAGAIGEHHHTHPDVDSLVYLTISSGIGAGVISDGSPLLGTDGNAGEVGHMTIDAAGRLPCGCGAAGHWEAYCSGNSIPALARLLAADGGERKSENENEVEDEDRHTETALPLESNDLTAAEIFEHAGSDPLATHVVDRVAELNVLGMGNVINAYAPAVVSVGGAVALNNQSLVLDPIREEIESQLVVQTPEIVCSDLGEEAVLRGALRCAFTGTSGGLDG